jgi:hypothetical protein
MVENSKGKLSDISGNRTEQLDPGTAAQRQLRCRPPRRAQAVIMSLGDYLRNFTLYIQIENLNTCTLDVPYMSTFLQWAETQISNGAGPT